MATANHDRDVLLAHLLAGGKSLSEAARLAKVSRSTVARRRKDPEFVALIEQEVEALVGESRRQLVSHANTVTAVLVSIAGDKSEKATSRVAACRSVLEYGLRFSEMVDVKSRLSSLEEAWTTFKNDL